MAENFIRAGFRTINEINFKLSFKEFIETNPLADETFYIKFLLNNQKKEILRLENDVSIFFDNFDEISGDEVKMAKYIENKKKRDHFWMLKEYSLFLEERLRELSIPKAQLIEKPLQLSLSEIAMYFYYCNENITQQNANAIAHEHGHNSGKKLLQHYNEYHSRSNRIASGESEIKQKNKVEKLEKIIGLLSSRGLEILKAQQDLNDLNDNFKNQ